MKDNASVVVRGPRVQLVPYATRFVPRYHAWMQDEALLEATASERLTLEQELENQASWHRDAQKCTFIIVRGGPASLDHAVQHMIGDVNLFLSRDNDDDDGDDDDGDDHEAVTVAEVEVMIADETARGQGHGKHAVLMMMHYAMQSLGINRFIAKIGDANKASLGMFQHCLLFQQQSHSDVFAETTLSASAATLDLVSEFARQNAIDILPDAWTTPVIEQVPSSTG